MKRLRPSQDVRPLAEFRAKLATVLNQVRRTRRPVINTQRSSRAKRKRSAIAQAGGCNLSPLLALTARSA
jgi:hypothetical protein